MACCSDSNCFDVIFSNVLLTTFVPSWTFSIPGGTEPPGVDLAPLMQCLCSDRQVEPKKSRLGGAKSLMKTKQAHSNPFWERPASQLADYDIFGKAKIDFRAEMIIMQQRCLPFKNNTSMMFHLSFEAHQKHHRSFKDLLRKKGEKHNTSKSSTHLFISRLIRRSLSKTAPGITNWSSRRLLAPSTRRALVAENPSQKP